MNKLLIASDSFKGSLTSIEIGNIFKGVNPSTKILSISDGGEGFVESVVFNSPEAKLIKVKTFDEKMKEIEVEVAVIDNDAYIDVASVVALHNYPNESAIHKSSFGVGHLIKSLDESKKYKKIFIGLGGASTSDGGFGAALGFGVKFLDSDDKEIKDLSSICKCKNIIIPKINVNVIGYSDVTNELNGTNGAVSVFGTQKWLTDKEKETLSKNIEAFSKDSKNAIKQGAGAAGGLGYFIYEFLDGNLMSGINKILELSQLSKLSEDADILITGEGRFDNQSFFGKVPIEVAKASKTKNILIAGSIEADESELKKYFHSWYSLKREDETVDECIIATEDRLKVIAKEIAEI